MLRPSVFWNRQCASYSLNGSKVGYVAGSFFFAC